MGQRVTQQQKKKVHYVHTNKQQNTLRNRCVGTQQRLRVGQVWKKDTDPTKPQGIRKRIDPQRKSPEIQENFSFADDCKLSSNARVSIQNLSVSATTKCSHGSSVFGVPQQQTHSIATVTFSPLCTHSLSSGHLGQTCTFLNEMHCW